MGSWKKVLERQLFAGTTKEAIARVFSFPNVFANAVPENRFVLELLKSVHNKGPSLLPHTRRISDYLRVLPVDQLAECLHCRGRRIWSRANKVQGESKRLCHRHSLRRTNGRRNCDLLGVHLRSRRSVVLSWLVMLSRRVNTTRPCTTGFRQSCLAASDFRGRCRSGLRDHRWSKRPSISVSLRLESLQTSPPMGLIPLHVFSGLLCTGQQVESVP
jgi:hypothetical protein